MALSSARKKEILDTVAKLRVTDVRDGLDWVGRHNIGTVSPEIRPLWRTKAAGFAVTCRHIPTQRTVPTMTPGDYTKWAYEYWYGEVFANDLADQFSDTSFLVVDTCNTPTPAVGSMDSMIWAALGARGVLTNGGTRDSDETLEQKAIPIWSRWIVQPMYQGRVEWGGHSMPVEVGGQLVRPDDLVVADGDGAIVVPEELIDDVLTYAIQESENDKRVRALLFDRLGIPRNASTESVFEVEPHPYALSAEALDKRLKRA
ncbi:RraA family protein [Streptomyces radicis]|uniref:Putative 4-hydroxy-4-methyl-2-oxoglutarate aldolase n=1 Tax=Streptomyces radicis TaxID=1750517 RepID=A0A3A9WDV6_9ACTN|nr:RraA family protein [Streptomyces radicis]RKN10950.1 RraA family protein [Streptomyces radicis]RKN25213.1 RraA family protein [Streptomyces radicis]